MSRAEGPRRHIIIPDCQVRPGVPTDHIDWIGAYIAEKKPEVVVCLGDFWDLASLNSHSEKGSLPLEGTRYKDDIWTGNEAFKRLTAPIDSEVARLRANKRKVWNPRKTFLKGNHEIRADRTFNNDPRFEGVLSSDDCLTPGWERHEFLRVVDIDGILYSHYFKMQNSNNPIGGSTDNRLNKIGASHVQGHQVGFLYGNRVYPDGKTRHSLTCGSAYIHDEEYRGPQCNKHFRGIVVLQEVHDGDFLVMPVSLDFLCRKYTGDSLQRYLTLKYASGNWENL